MLLPTTYFLLVNISLINPYFHTDRTICGIRCFLGIVNIRAKRLQRNPSALAPFVARHFSSVQTPLDRDFYTLNLARGRYFVQSLLQRAAKRQPLFNILHHHLCCDCGMSLGRAYFFNRNLDLGLFGRYRRVFAPSRARTETRKKALNVALDFLRAFPAASDQDARARGFENDMQRIREALNFNGLQVRRAECPLKPCTKKRILAQILLKTGRIKPA